MHRLSESVQVPVTPELKETLRSQAQREWLPMAALVRKAVREYLERESAHPEQQRKGDEAHDG